MKTDLYRFSPEEIGLERLIIDGHCYIDVTPLYLDSKKSLEVYERIEEIRSRRELHERLKNMRREKKQ